MDQRRYRPDSAGGDATAGRPQRFWPGGGSEPGMNRRGALEAEDLLKLVLLLVVVWIVIEILGATLGLLTGLFGLLPDVLGLVIIVLVILWLLDRI